MHGHTNIKFCKSTIDPWKVMPYSVSAMNAKGPNVICQACRVSVLFSQNNEEKIAVIHSPQDVQGKTTSIHVRTPVTLLLTNRFIAKMRSHIYIYIYKTGYLSNFLYIHYLKMRFFLNLCSYCHNGTNQFKFSLLLLPHISTFMHSRMI
jgi:hypothetical protein